MRTPDGQWEANFGLAKMSTQPDGYHVVTIRNYGHLAINPAYLETYGTPGRGFPR